MNPLGGDVATASVIRFDLTGMKDGRVYLTPVPTTTTDSGAFIRTVPARLVPRHFRFSGGVWSRYPGEPWKLARG